jgi:hypothetical protein
MATAPLATLIHGSLTIEQGCDITSFGSGDITVNNNAYINGTQNSTSSGTGALVLAYGGLGVAQDTNLLGTLTVSSTSNLQTTNIDTTLGGLNVSGGNAVNINVSAASQFVSYGTLTLNSSAGNAILESGLNSPTAVQVLATNAGGGVNVLSGQSGEIQLTAGTNGIQGVTSSGSINLTANGASGSFQVNSSAANQNLTIGVNGATDSQLLLQSAGTNTTNNAIQIQSSAAGGNILITNNSTGTGSITSYAGSGGYGVTTYTGGSIQLTANAASSYFVVNSTGGSGQSLTVGVNGALPNSNLILQSAGTNSTSAILIQNTNTAGGIQLTNGPLSSGAVVIDTGSSGLSALTQNGGGINLTAIGASSSFINKTNSAGQDLTICVQSTGATYGSNLVLCNQAGGNINTNTASGGSVAISSSGQVNINSSDSTNGINIGTLQTVPVRIGTNTSTTTILGNLDVQGTTTTIESTTVQITDNIIQLNNGPTGTADSGLAVKRFQGWVDGTLVGTTCTGITGDVVADVAENYNSGAYNTTGSGSTTTILALDPTDPNYNNAGYYNGWWVKILPNPVGPVTTGACQVRRIKTHTGSTAIIYTTADETASPNIPAQGHDFSTAPASGTLYALYPCAWIISMWDSVNSEWSIVCSPMEAVTATPPIAYYVNMHINNLTANAITATTINGTTADVQGTFNLTDNSTTGASLTLPSGLNYGIYFVLIRPTTATTTRTHAIFAIGRLNSTTGCGQVVRLIAVKGVNGDNLDMQWPANSLPQVLYRPAPGGSTITNYTYKVITV